MSELTDEMSHAFARSEGGLLTYAAAFLTMLLPAGPDDDECTVQHVECITLLERLAGVDIGEVAKRVEDPSASNLDKANSAVTTFADGPAWSLAFPPRRPHWSATSSNCTTLNWVHIRSSVECQCDPKAPTGGSTGPHV
jgi:hypothetical protein